MNRDELMDRALTREELDELKPSTEEMFEGTDDAERWYNEAVYTAARGFVLAAEESDQFREDFMSEETVEVEAFPNEDGDDASTVDTDKWRDTMAEETPTRYENVMGIGLSAFQGGNAEQVARRVLGEANE